MPIVEWNNEAKIQFLGFSANFQFYHDQAKGNLFLKWL